MERTREKGRARGKYALCKTDRQTHANKCLIKQSELAPGTDRKIDDEEEPLEKKKSKENSDRAAQLCIFH